MPTVKSSKRRPTPRPEALEDSKLRLVQAAETLFADRGIEGVSMREIAQLAGHANTNAVQYHFGGRDGLVEAISTWRVSEMELPRERMFAEAEAEGSLSDLLVLMRILLLPYLDLVNEKGRHTYAGFMSQYLLRQRSGGMRHAADFRSDIAVNIQRLMGLLYDQVGVNDRKMGDYRIALASLVFCNMLVLADTEQLPQRDPRQFSQRVDVALRMATVALREASTPSV